MKHVWGHAPKHETVADIIERDTPLVCQNNGEIQMWVKQNLDSFLVTKIVQHTICCDGEERGIMLLACKQLGPCLVDKKV